MPREIEPPINQRDFLLSALSEGKRLDGRLPLEMRDIRLEFGEALGWCRCHLGKTS
jgi:exosome complex component RRP45